MKDHPPLHSCIVIGAGISGLIAARTLADAGVDVLVLDKARGVGGRMATRRIGTARFDHGAQHITATGPEFQRLVDDWMTAGVARLWSRGFPNNGNSEAGAHYCGCDGMTAVPKLLAAGLNVRLDTRVNSIAPARNRWIIRTAREEEFEAEAIIATAPIPQSLEMLRAGYAILPTYVLAHLVNVQYDPAMAVMLLYGRSSGVPQPGGMPLDNPAIAWLADNHAKGISPGGHGVTILTTAAFTRSLWDAPDDEIVAAVTAHAAQWLPEKPLASQVHRWRYSHPTTSYPEPFLFIEEPAPLLFAGDAFGRGTVEGAALSGRGAGSALLARIA